jgi:formylglycine-generating enzyme
MPGTTTDTTRAAPPGPPPFKGMVWIPGGTFLMGSDDHYPEEAPVHEMTVAGFWIASAPVTNAEFRRFVKETGHVTSAERAPDPADYPGAKPELLVPASVVFQKTRQRVDLRDPYSWWTYVPGADWRHPQGPASTLHGRERHPVVHVAYEDVEAYLAWAGKALPTEAEWEFAARGGLEGAEYAWGNELTRRGKHLANTWQGEFPHENLLTDGYEGTSPVGSFPPNGYGLSDMIGNVWEWTADYYRETADSDAGSVSSPPCCRATPKAPEDSRQRVAESSAPMSTPLRVVKGGSHLCAPNYCQRYRPSARWPQPVDTSTSHIWFRCVRLSVP